MAVGQLKEDEADSLFQILQMLISLIDQGIITEGEAETVRSLVNDKLHEALGLE